MFDVLCAGFEARYPFEVRALVEMVSCATVGDGREFLQFDPAEPHGSSWGAAALHECINLYCDKHAITKSEFTRALHDYREMNSFPPEFAEGFVAYIEMRLGNSGPAVPLRVPAPEEPAPDQQHDAQNSALFDAMKQKAMALRQKATEATLQAIHGDLTKAAAIERRAGALQDQAAALAVVRGTNDEISALRATRGTNGARTPANKHAVLALIVRQQAEKGVLDAANFAVRACKEAIREAAIVERRVRV
ncbi:hypothetical protein J7E70_30275 [Variovorax paradoxus]|nr:hypothetical protein [Variovorax paradoxus]MBT2304709.1 hypothetical protein [Variovorax paradoxus]